DSRAGEKADLGSREGRLVAIAFPADGDAAGKDEARGEQPRALQIRTHVPVDVDRLGWEIEYPLEAREAASAEPVLVSGKVARGVPVLIEEDPGVGSLAGGAHLDRR